MAETEVCYPTPISKMGVDMQGAAMYMAVAAGGASWYYTPATLSLQDKTVNALAAGAVAAIAANIIGLASKSWLQKCR